MLYVQYKCISSLNSTSGKSKKRKSLVISNPIPCNTAFPADHVSIHATTQNEKDAVPSSPAEQAQSISEEASQPEESSVSSKDVNSSDSDLSTSGINTPKRQSVCGNENDNRSTEGGQGPEAEAELATNQSDDSWVGVPKSEAASQNVSKPSDSADSDDPQSPDQEKVTDPPSEESKPKSVPVPAPRISFRSTDKRTLLPAKEQEDSEEELETQEAAESEEDSSSQNPPGFLYKVHNNVVVINIVYIYSNANSDYVKAVWKYHLSLQLSLVLMSITVF